MELFLYIFEHLNILISKWKSEFPFHVLMFLALHLSISFSTWVLEFWVEYSVLSGMVFPLPSSFFLYLTFLSSGFGIASTWTLSTPTPMAPTHIHTAHLCPRFLTRLYIDWEFSATRDVEDITHSVTKQTSTLFVFLFLPLLILNFESSSQ